MSKYRWNTQKAIDFCFLCAELELWAWGKGYFLVRDWAKRDMAAQVSIYGKERQSYHLYSRAQDYTLFIKEGGKYVWIEDGTHPVWDEIADKAEELGLGTGRDWDDINHVELP